MYWLFVPAYGEHVERASGFHPKSVLVADVTDESSLDGNGTAYLTVVGVNGVPALVKAPQIPAALDAGPPGGFAESRRLLHAYGSACVDRVNLLVPVARTLTTPNIEAPK